MAVCPEAGQFIDTDNDSDYIVTHQPEKNAEVRGGEGGYKLRLTYSKTGLIRFISHRDLIRVFFRAFSRAGLPVAYSRGFSPHPRVSFCPPLKVGMEGLNEMLDITLSRPVDPEAAAESLRPRLPEGIAVGGCRLLEGPVPSLNSRLEMAEYRVRLADPVRVSREAIERFLDASEVPVTLIRGGEEKTVNARRGVVELDWSGEGESRMVLSLKETGRPYAVLAALSGADFRLLAGLRWRRMGFLP